MGIIRKLSDKIELYDPTTGESFLHYDESNDEVVSDKPLSTDEAQLTRYSKNIQLSEYSTGGSGTGSDPYIIDLQDVFNDVSSTVATDLVVDGIFELGVERNIPPQYRFWGGTGRPDNDRGSVLRAASNFSGTSLVHYEGGPSVSQSNYGGAVGVFFDAANNADRAVTTVKPGRNKWFRDCSFGNALVYGVRPRGRLTTFINCNLRDNDANGAVGAYINSQQTDWIGGRFASNETDVRISEGGIDGKVSFSNIVCANHWENPSILIDAPVSNPNAEAAIHFSDCQWTDFRSAVNAIKVGQSGDAFTIPIKLTNLTFDGTDRQNGGAKGNKAINAPCDRVEGELVVESVTAKNFTGSPVVDTTNVQGSDVRREGTYEVNSDPTTLSWSGDQAGADIIDKTSTSGPYDRYTVLQDGTVDGPY